MNKQLADFSTLHNFPENFVQFIGREQELAAVKNQLIEQHISLVTITGTGGVGKTQLALQFAAINFAAFRDGVWLVELSNLDEASLVAETIFYSLNLVEQVGTSILDSLLENLKERQLLLILDNCERLATACGKISQLIISNCPNVQIIATSREKLGIANEEILGLTPFSLPVEMPTLESATNLAAINLFYNRALEVNPRWKLTRQNLSAVVELCRKLDGIPLAITLAAARIKVLSVEQILARLSDMFLLLKSDSDNFLPHQQALKTTLEWSYALLDENEQTSWRHLAIFSGSWTLEAAEQLCGSANQTDLQVLDNIESLINKSLLVAEPSSETKEIRYRFLETIRQYGLTKLAENRELETLHFRQIKYCLDLINKAEPHLRGGPEQQAWLTRLELDLANLRDAFNWVLANNSPELTSLALQISSKSFGFWLLRGHLTEGFYWLKAVSEHAETAGNQNSAKDWQAALAINLRGLGMFSDMQGSYNEAKIYYTAALDIFKKLDEKRGIASISNNLGLTLLQQGFHTEARQQFEESLKYFRELDDRRGIWNALTNLGSSSLFSKDYTQAEAFYQEALPITRQLQNVEGTLLIYINLGQIAFAQKNYKQAEQWYELSLALYREGEDKKGIANSLENLGVALIQQGQIQRADQVLLESLEMWSNLGNKAGLIRILEARALLAFNLGQLEIALKLWGAAEFQRQASAVVMEPTYEMDYSQALDITRSMVGDGEFTATRMVGRTLTLDEALSLSLNLTPADEDSPARLKHWLKAEALWSEKYRLEKQLGSGGMGEVWLVKDLTLDEPRAIKFMLSEQINNSRARRRFIQGEARNALRLAPHPNIVRVYELGFYNEIPFIVMEFIQSSSLGADLRTYLRQHGPLTPQEAGNLVSQIAAGLEVAHKSGMIHRDIKPANILLEATEQGGVVCKIGDFGLVKDIESDIELTTHTQIFGTPIYMAPEQARGKATPASDIYALGIMAYEMLSGQPPFKGSTGDLLLQHFSVPPPALPETIPPKLSEVVLRALAKKPEDRPASAAIFEQEFRAAMVTP